MRDIWSFLSQLLDVSDFPARWHCGRWTDGHGWLHILSDLGIWSAYFAIPLVLGYFLVRRRDLPFRAIFRLFAAFIVLCGSTHLMEALIFWWPAYRLAGVLKLATAIVSWSTVFALVRTSPTLLSMRLPEELEGLVQERTAQLEIATAKLRAERQLLRTTLASIGDAVITTDVSGRVTNMNPTAEALTGWTLTEATHQPLESVFRIINEQTRLPVDDPAQKALRTGTVVGLANHTILIGKDGTEIPIDDSAAPIRDDGELMGCVLVFRDITERHRQQAELEAREQLFISLAESMPQLCWMADPDGHIFWYNRRWYEYTGTTPEQMLGWGWQSVHDPEALPMALERWRSSLASGEPVDTVFPLRGKDGVLRPFLTRVEPLKDEQGQIIRWFGTNTDISEQKRIEQELSVARQQSVEALASLDSLVTNAPIGIGFYDQELRFRKLNPALAEFSGIPPDAHIGRTIQEVAPNVSDETVANIAGVFRSGQALPQREVRWQSPHQPGLRDCLVNYYPVRNTAGETTGVGVTVMDVTALREAERERERVWQKHQFHLNLIKAITDNAATAIFMMDADGRCTFMNPAAEKMTGFEFGEVEGGVLHDFIHHRHPDGRPYPQSECPIDRALPENRAVEDHQDTFVRKSGELFPVVVNAKPLQDDDNERGTVIEVRDVSQEKETAATLREIATELSEANHRKDEFLATLAHELRNPLAPIRNGLQLMKVARSEEVLERSRNVMERQLEHMVRLVDDLLDLSRITRGKLQLKKQRLPLATAVEAAVDACQPLITDAEHELKVIMPTEPIMVVADPTRLAQVFGNLLNNAAKYTRTGGHIRLEVKLEGGRATVTLTDDGDGIPADKLGSIFDMFTQVDSSLEKSRGGLGIGLTLVKRLIEMHGGTIEARSDGVGRGSTFTVTLPTATSVEQPQASAGEPLEHGSSPEALRVLIVDDNQDAADTLAMMLQIVGHDTHTAYDGQAGIELAAEIRPDVIVFDIGLPKLNGYAAARWVRQQPWGRELVLIALTGWGQEDYRDRSREAGFDHHLVKPVERAAFQKVLPDSGSRRG